MFVRLTGPPACAMRMELVNSVKLNSVGPDVTSVMPVTPVRTASRVTLKITTKLPPTGPVPCASVTVTMTPPPYCAVQATNVRAGLATLAMLVEHVKPITTRLSPTPRVLSPARVAPLNVTPVLPPVRRTGASVIINSTQLTNVSFA